MGKSVFERMAEAQKKGTFEGTMAAAGKEIRWFNEEYFATHSSAEIARELSQSEYEYYHEKVKGVMTKEGKDEHARKQKELDDFLSMVESKKQAAFNEVKRKISHLPAPIRPDENIIMRDIKRIVGNPMAQDDSWMKKLDEYVGVASTGELPNTDLG